MSCTSKRAEATRNPEGTRSVQRSACPCESCPPKAKWLCLAGLVAGVGLLAFRALRRSPAPT